MFVEISLPDELLQSAELLEERLRALRIPARQVSPAEWEIIPENLHPFIPVWYPSLLAKFSLYGAVLKCAPFRMFDFSKGWSFAFPVWGPEQFVEALQKRDVQEVILKKECVPISRETAINNGSYWFMPMKSDPSSPIYFYEASGEYTFLETEPILPQFKPNDPFKFASSRIALLLASMAISEKSFDGFLGRTEPTSVLWYPAPDAPPCERRIFL